MCISLFTPTVDLGLWEVLSVFADSTGLIEFNPSPVTLVTKISSQEHQTRKWVPGIERSTDGSRQRIVRVASTRR
ncbi:hypothetical protein [Neorhodopirellula lusitana]|uniref:hypothetical protein n=1 Tax=Neorhodopirellula lusitana TaxID=445327 RepID=UPI00384C9C34